MKLQMLLEGNTLDDSKFYVYFIDSPPPEVLIVKECDSEDLAEKHKKKVESDAVRRNVFFDQFRIDTGKRIKNLFKQRKMSFYKDWNNK